MGNACAPKLHEVDGEALEADREINKALKRDRKEQEIERRLLLLGAGESGKSTICKQFLILNNSFTEKDRLSYAYFIQVVAINCMRTLIMRVINELHSSLLVDANLVRDSSFEAERPLTKDLSTAIKRLWESDLIQQAYSQRKEYYLPECASFLFQNIMRYCEADYIPTEEDCLRVRKRTCGVAEYTFNHEGIKFRVIDVGGQRSERRKWLVAFEGYITAVLYTIACEEYDMHLAEAAGVNRMLEALQLFADVTATGVLQNIPIILFFNKSDLLKEKLKQGITPASLFKEYKG
eukprot:CAMPEP_0177663078 /NCGR_PEP_ID=MMETSP0447-20121125/19719_1 /TAXON_ID=0 /ORGANISM="Stygamoeba regulata, Strain BSH-02190019" /LENGTH=292 /DNA_ID=CAMNT_0019168861 /DNA_START=291 /DNA_END=1165 /DNA_ORIENTATION=-